MTNEEIQQFYRDIADVCLKHNMDGIAGVWFSGKGHNEFGQMAYWPIENTHMKAVIDLIASKYDTWARDVLKHTPKPLGVIREVRGSDGMKN